MVYKNRAFNASREKILDALGKSQAKEFTVLIKDMSPEVKLEKFQGPLDLLLQLVEQEKMDITEISLSQITEQFLSYLVKLEETRADELADFLVVATRLIYLKSRILLPELAADEDSGISLADQLKMYRQYVEAGKKIEAIWNEWHISYGRIEPPVKPEGLVFSHNAQASDLRQAMESLVQRLKPLNPLPQVIMGKTVTIQQKVAEIYEALKHLRQVSFKKLLSSAQSRTEAIVSFLALLELAKDGRAVVGQDGIFGEILVKKA